MLFMVITASGTFFHEKVNNLLLGISASVFAAVFVIVFLRDLDRRNEATLARIEEALLSVSTVSAEFRRVGRNTEMGDAYWLGLIQDLGTLRDGGFSSLAMSFPDGGTVPPTVQPFDKN